MNCDLWIVEGESDWNDYDVCLSGLSSLYTKNELSRGIFRGSLLRALPLPLSLSSIYKKKKMKKKMKAEQVKEEKAPSWSGKRRFGVQGGAKFQTLVHLSK